MLSIRKYIFLFFLLVLVCGTADARRKKILVLHSYHQGLNWTDHITNGILSELKPENNLEIQFEYMDTKRQYDKEYLDEFVKLYRHKHKNIPYNVVIASDNNALYFTRDHQEEFFKDIPIVFCSIDQFQDSLIAGMKHVTGITEDIDFKRTVQQALRLHPKAKNLVVINDNVTTSAIINREYIKSFWPDLNTNVKLKFLENLSISELVEKVKKLDDSNIILLINFSRDKNGEYISYQENIEIIREATQLPIYSSWEFYLGEGIVGGMLTSGFQEGKLAADLALQIINGTPVDSIPIVNTGYNSYKFDYQQMSRFGIRVQDLPEGSTVINQPPGFFEKHQISLILVVSFLILILLIIVFARVKRRQAENRLIAKNNQLKSSRNRLLRMLDANSDGVWEHNFIQHTTYLSKNIWEKLGYHADLVQNKPEFVEKRIHPEDVKHFLEERSKLENKQIDLFIVEFRMQAKDQSWIWLKAKAKVLEFNNEKRAVNLVGTLIDITQRKLAEAKNREAEIKIRASEKRWRSLVEQASYEIVIHDLQGNILDVNPATCQWLGYSREELIGSNFSDFDQNFTSEQFHQIWNNLNTDHPSIKLDSTQMRKDQSLFPVEIQLSLIDLSDSKLILAVASDMSIRKETERNVLNAVIAAEENERKRFATDLHDSIGPLLSSINLYLSALGKSDTNTKNQKIISASREIVNETLINIKEISNNLSPHILNDFGLENAIQTFIQKLILTDHININLETKGLNQRFSQQVEVVLYRVVTELINNTIKHARAQNIQINIKHEAQNLNLIYMDDGVGFDIDKVSGKKDSGMGLYNILSRINSLDGTSKIQSNPEQGGMMAIINIKL